VHLVGYFHRFLISNFPVTPFVWTFQLTVSMHK